MLQLDDAVAAVTPDAIALLEDLVRADSTMGQEAAAEQVLAAAAALLEGADAIEGDPVPPDIRV